MGCVRPRARVWGIVWGWGAWRVRHCVCEMRYEGLMALKWLLVQKWKELLRCGECEGPTRAACRIFRGETS